MHSGSFVQVHSFMTCSLVGVAPIVSARITCRHPGHCTPDVSGYWWVSGLAGVASRVAPSLHTLDVAGVEELVQSAALTVVEPRIVLILC